MANVATPEKISNCYWRPGSRVKVDPYMARSEFMAVRVANRGRLTPDGVLDRAQDEGSILHDEFTWDDQAAASVFRHEEAEQLIRSLVVVYQREDTDPEIPVATRSVPAFIRIRPHSDTPAVTDFERVVTEKGNYVPIEQVMADSGTRRMLLNQAWRDFASLRRKYQELSEFADIFEAIDRAKDKIA